MGAVRNATYFGQDSQEDRNSQKKIALRAFIGYNTVEDSEMRSFPGLGPTMCGCLSARAVKAEETISKRWNR